MNVRLFARARRINRTKQRLRVVAQVGRVELILQWSDSKTAKNMRECENAISNLVMAIAV
jgi:hypothetical protein